MSKCHEVNLVDAEGGRSSEKDSIVTNLSKESDTEDYSLFSYFSDSSFSRTFLLLIKDVDFSSVLHKTILSGLLLAHYVYFAAVVLHSSADESEDYWCHGEGFLIILGSLAHLLLIYFKVLKPQLKKKGIGDAEWFNRGRDASVKLKSIFGRRIVQRFLSFAFVLGVITFVVIDSADDRSRLVSLVGILVLILFGFLFSKAPRKVIWRQVLWGLGLQFMMGLIILRWSVGQATFSCLGSKVHSFLLFTNVGSQFVYGKLISELQVFVFKVLSVILFFNFCAQILFYYGVMQWIIIKLGWLLQITIGTTACESVSSVANIFFGMNEAPLLIKPFLPKMTKSELHAVMTGGFATIAGSAMAAYIPFGVDPSHLLSASFMSAPAALGFSKLFYPELEVSQTQAENLEIKKGSHANVLHAACDGVAAAIPLVATIAANLLAFIAFMGFVDSLLNWFCGLVAIDEGVCSLSNIFGYAFMPLAWIMGVQWQDCYEVGQLIGAKMVINEFVGYLKMVDYVKKKMISKRSEIISTYALCGFCNIPGVGIQMAALGSIVPEKRHDLAQVALRAMIAGSAACFLTACVAGCLITSND